MTTKAEYFVTHSLGTTGPIVINQNSSGPKPLGQFYFRAGDTVSVNLEVTEEQNNQCGLRDLCPAGEL